MREIKFRAWDKKKKQMLIVGWLALPSPQNGYSFGHFDKDGLIEEIESKNIELMQYTGLNDKNGKEIYEGDIVKCDIDEWSGEVVFVDGYFGVKDKVGIRHLKINDINNEVIGNIYET